MPFYIWTYEINKNIFQNTISYEGKTKKKSAEKAKKLNFTLFWALYF